MGERSRWRRDDRSTASKFFALKYLLGLALLAQLPVGDVVNFPALVFNLDVFLDYLADARLDNGALMKPGSYGGLRFWTRDSVQVLSLWRRLAELLKRVP
jgi:hypothetical protein